jgi:rSAM/selenodomain-associated transferase 1
LIVVAKEPLPGATKTRLCPPFSAAQAADFYRCLLLDTLGLAGRLQTVDRTIAYTPAGARVFFEPFGRNGYRLIAQQGAHLGERLANALAHHFSLGYARVVIMNSDGPTLPLAHLEEAFSALNSAAVTLGPGHDGGYYLIGMTEPHPELFRGIAWSTPQVIPQTLAICKQQGLVVHCLPEWYDVDVADDLARLRRDLERQPAAAPHTAAFLRNWRRD